MKTVLAFLLISFSGLQTNAQTSSNASAAGNGDSNIELQCKAKAKEVAVDVYNNCVTEARNQEIDRIRNEYKAKLQEMKSYYNNELKKIAPSSSPTTQSPSARNSNTMASPAKAKSMSYGRRNSAPQPNSYAADSNPEAPGPIINNKSVKREDIADSKQSGSTQADKKTAQKDVPPEPEIYDMGSDN